MGKSKSKGFILKNENDFYYKGEDRVGGASRSSVTRDKEWAFHFDDITTAHRWASWLSERRGEGYTVEEDK